MKRSKVEISSYHGSRRDQIRALAPLCAAAVFLLLAVLCWTVLPGMGFSGWLCLLLALICGLWAALDRWAEQEAAGRWARRVFRIVLGCFVLSFAVTEGLIFHAASAAVPATKPVAVIVLGAGVNGSTPSLVLQSRIDAAAAYLAGLPADVPVILSGGQGSGENITEAQCMYNGLVAAGMDGKRLHLEERSTSTAENFACSVAVLDSLGVDTYGGAVAVVSSDFHLFRARLLAERATLTTFGVPAKLPWLLLEGNYCAREYFALVKLAVF